jgi:hypothetical protein
VPQGGTRNQVTLAEPQTHQAQLKPAVNGIVRGPERQSAESLARSEVIGGYNCRG